MRVCVCVCVCVCVSVFKTEHLFSKLFFGDFNDLLLCAVAVPVVGPVLTHQLLQDKEQQLVVVLLVREEVTKSLDGGELVSGIISFCFLETD